MTNGSAQIRRQESLRGGSPEVSVARIGDVTAEALSFALGPDLLKTDVGKCSRSGSRSRVTVAFEVKLSVYIRTVAARQ